MRTFLCASLFLAAGLCHAQSADVKNFTTKEDVVYGKGVSGALKGDAYIPDGKGPFPAILFIHGGGWSSGTHHQMDRLIKALANKGYAAFTIDYDLVPTHFPVALDESLAALAYMRSHARQWHIDVNRMAVAGSSAGGELAALVALTPKGAPPVQAAIILNGVLDLEDLGDRSKMVTDYLGGPCSAMRTACKEASPTAQVHPGAPAFYIGHGTADETVPYAQAEQFVAALKAANVPVTAFVAKDGPHTYWLRDKFFMQNLEGVESFLAETLPAPRP